MWISFHAAVIPSACGRHVIPTDLTPQGCVEVKILDCAKICKSQLPHLPVQKWCYIPIYKILYAYIRYIHLYIYYTTLNPLMVLVASLNKLRGPNNIDLLTVFWHLIMFAKSSLWHPFLLLLILSTLLPVGFPELSIESHGFP